MSKLDPPSHSNLELVAQTISPPFLGCCLCLKISVCGGYRRLKEERLSKQTGEGTGFSCIQIPFLFQSCICQCEAVSRQFLSIWSACLCLGPCVCIDAIIIYVTIKNPSFLLGEFI